MRPFPTRTQGGPPLIAPSLLAADYARLGEEVRAVEAAGADILHLDVMDGHFVPNISFGPAVIGALRDHTALPFDIHLMIAPAEPYIDAFVAVGAASITIHVEATHHLDRALEQIRSKGPLAGVAINPATPIAALEPVLHRVDIINVMTVNPGFGGQAFLPNAAERLAAVHTLVGDRPIHVEADGGVSAKTAADAASAGASILIAGSAVFGTDNYAKAIDTLRTA
ncbi:MAG: ribulose-phosphate 3-epimerase [Pseudomonadota bacterium]